MTTVTLRQLSTLVCKKFKNNQDEIDIWYEKYNKVKKKRKRNLIESQNYKCDVCGEELICDTEKNSRKNSRLATIEHVVPVCKGGTDSPSNWTITCNSCNNTRGNMDYEYFKENYKTIKRKRIEHKLARMKSKQAGELSEKDIKRKQAISYGLCLLFMYNHKIKDFFQTFVDKENEHSNKRVSEIKTLQKTLCTL